MPGTGKDTEHLILHEPGTQLAEIGFSRAINVVSLRRGALVCSIVWLHSTLHSSLLSMVQEISR